MKWRLMMAMILCGSILLGCAEDNPGPIASHNEYSLGLAGPIRDREMGGSPEIRFYHDEESFLADHGEVFSDMFHQFVAPDTACPGEVEPCCPYPVPRNLGNPFRAIVGPVRVVSEGCLRSEIREGEESPAIVVPAPGKLRFISFYRGMLIKCEGGVHGTVKLADGSETGFAIPASSGEITVFGIGTDIDIVEVRFHHEVVLRSILAYAGDEELDSAVVANMQIIADGFERFAELTGGMYPVLEYSTTWYGYTLEDLLPGGHYPINPFDGMPTSFSWAAGPAGSPGACAAGTALPGFFKIIGRGTTWFVGPLPVEILPPPMPDRVFRNMRAIRSGLELFAHRNRGRYPVGPSDTTLSGETLVDLLPGDAYPFSPYTFGEDGLNDPEPTNVSWNEGAAHESGAIAILEATPERYVVRGRGDDPDAYIEKILISGIVGNHTITVEQKEQQVVRNMHLIANAFEEFAELNGGNYPTYKYSALPDGRRLEDLFQTGYFPINPFTRSTTDFDWNHVPSPEPGSIAATTAQEHYYEIRGRGADPLAYLDTTITSE